MPSYESTTRRMPADQPGLCALIQDTLPFYLEGDLSPESRAFIDAHLETCDRCTSFLAGAQSIRGHFRREPMARSAVIDNDWRAREIIARGRLQMLPLMLAVVGVLSLLAFVTGTMQLLPLMLAVIGVLALLGVLSLLAFVTGTTQQLPLMLAVIGVLALIAFAGARTRTQSDSSVPAYATAAPAEPANGESVPVPTVAPAAAVEAIPTVVPTATPFLQPATSLQPTPTPVPAQP